MSAPSTVEVAKHAIASSELSDEQKIAAFALLTEKTVLDVLHGMAPHQMVKVVQKIMESTSDKAAPSSSVVSATPDLVAFWSNLPHAQLGNKLNANATHGATGKIFKLPNQAHILGRPELGDSIYIRPSYETVYSKIITKLSAAHLKGIVVVGTPGIGKSIFACYLMYRLHQAHPAASIIYIDYKRISDKFMMFSTAAGVQVSNTIDTFKLATASPNNFVIFDMGGNNCPSVPSSGIGAQVIVLSSANAAHFDTFHRQYKSMLVMKTWSKEEIDEARQHIYTDTSFADYHLRYRDLGGVPRWVFDPDHKHAFLKNQFRQEMPIADYIHRVLELKDLTKIDVDKGARLVTYEVDDELQVTQVRWVSDLIGQWAMETLAHSSEKRTMDLLCELSENPAAGGAYGIAFEAWAHLQLAEGGSFDVRPLDGGAPSTLHIKKSLKTTYFDDFKEVNDDSYGRPNTKTAESIDGIYQPQHIFQMTVSKDKDVKLNGLNACIAGMRNPSTFIIAVPEMNYNKFKGVRLQPTPASQWPAVITQKLVLCIPIHRSKRKRQDWQNEAEKQLKKQNLDDAAVEELVAMQDEPSLMSLATAGMEVRTRILQSWSEVGKFPKANSKLHVFKQKQGAFVCIKLT